MTSLVDAPVNPPVQPISGLVTDPTGILESGPPCIPDHGVPVWCPGCAYDVEFDCS